MAKAKPDRWEGIDELYRAVVPDLKRMAFLITGSADFAEDAVHDAFLNVVPKVASLNDHETVKRYLRRAVVNETKKKYRTLVRRQKRQERFAENQSPVHYDKDSATTVALTQTLGALKPKQRTVIVLTYFYDYDDTTISNIMSCAVGTVKSTRARALAAIRKVYQEDDVHTRKTHLGLARPEQHLLAE